MTTAQEILALFLLWGVGHSLVAGVFFPSKRTWALFLSTLILASVYMLKPATGDLWSYSFYFDTGYSHIDYDAEERSGIQRTSPIEAGYPVETVEPRFRSGTPYFQGYPTSPLFTWMTKASAEFLPDGSKWPRFQANGFRAVSDYFLLEIVLIGLGLIWFFFQIEKPVNEFGKEKSIQIIEWLPFVFGSVFFFVGSQNSIRQFLMLSALLVLIAALSNKRYITAIIFGVITATFHQFGFLFIALVLLITFSQQIFSKKFIENRIAQYVAPILSGLLIGVAGVFCIKVAFFFDIQEIMQYGLHLDSDYFEYPFRTLAGIKWLSIAGLLLTSELILGRCEGVHLNRYREWRLAAVAFATPLVIYPEIFSRMLFFYFAIEMIFVIFAVFSRSIRACLSGIAVFAAYIVAPNALNLLVGSGWREILIQSYL
jgi:hypothetical protein